MEDYIKSKMANNLSFTELKEAVDKLNKNRLKQLDELSLVLYDKEYSDLSDDEKEKIRLVSGWHLSKESLSEDHVEKSIFPMEEFHKGLRIEKAEHSNLNILDIAQLVLDHLKEDEYYYSNDSNFESYKMFSNEDDAEIYRLDQESKGFKTEVQQIGEEYKVNCWRENEENLSHI